MPPSAGLFTYPVLMAADILIYDPDVVPVGKDQKQHLEMTRDIAVKINEPYGQIFKLPEPRIHAATETVPGLDGQKMSKSYGNTIDIFGDEKETRKRVMGIVTDSKPWKRRRTRELHRSSSFLARRLGGSDEMRIQAGPVTAISRSSCSRNCGKFRAHAQTPRRNSQ